MALFGLPILLIYYALTILKWIVLATVLLSWLPLLGIHIDPWHPVVSFMHRVTDPILAPLRPYSRLGQLDISPIIAFLIIGLLQRGLIDLTQPAVLAAAQLLGERLGRRPYLLAISNQNFVRTTIAFAISLVIAFTIHEFSHAWLADRLGDPTARRRGRLTLDPRKHLDVLGSIMVLTVRFGWAKPVPVNPNYLRSGPQQGMALVAAAGPFSNLILAALASFPLKLGLIESYFNLRLLPNPVQLCSTFVFLNVLLFFFNLLPIAPLDGFKIVAGLLPYPQSASFRKTEQFGPLILLVLIFFLPGLLQLLILEPTSTVVRMLS